MKPYQQLLFTMLLCFPAICHAQTGSGDKADTLKTLFKGKKVSLYKPLDNTKHAYYTLEKKQATSTKLRKDSLRQQLIVLGKKYQQDTADVLPFLRKAEYTDSSVTASVKVINNGMLYSRFRPFVGVVINSSRLIFSGNELDGGKSSRIVPGPTLGFSYYFSRRFFVSIEASFSSESHELRSHEPTAMTYNQSLGTIGTGALSLKQQSFDIIPFLGYNFYNRKKLKIYGGLGVINRFVNYSKIAFTFQPVETEMPLSIENYPLLKKNYHYYLLRVGVIVNNRIDLFSGVSHSYQIIKQDPFNAQNGEDRPMFGRGYFETFQLGARYYFK